MIMDYRCLVVVFSLLLSMLGQVNGEDCQMIDIVGVKGDNTQYSDITYAGSFQDCKNICLNDVPCIVAEFRGGSACFYSSTPVDVVQDATSTVSYKICSGITMLSASSVVIILSYAAVLFNRYL